MAQRCHKRRPVKGRPLRPNDNECDLQGACGKHGYFGLHSVFLSASLCVCTVGCMASAVTEVYMMRVERLVCAVA